MSNRVLAVAVALVTCTACNRATEVQPELPVVHSESSVSMSQSVSLSSQVQASETTSSVSPPKVLIPAPFSPQAPTANWDAAHEETCEEMSLILAFLAKQGVTSITAEEAEGQLQKLLAYELEHNYGQDITVAELQAIAKDYFNLSTSIISVRGEQDLVLPLSKGKLVIVPLAGRELGNPYFSGEGPWYHMVLLTGYTEESFITHDVGTRRGRNYKYDKLRFLNAIHDWTGVKEEIFRGERKALVIQ